MNCEHIEPWISAYQDGEIDARRRQIVREHLARCPACRAWRAEGEALAREIQANLTGVEAPASLHARVMLRIPEPGPASSRHAHLGAWRPQGWLSFGLVPIGAATAWLLLAPYATRPAPLPKGNRGSMVLAAAPLNAEAEPISASKPPALSSATPLHSKHGATQQPKLPRHPQATPEPPAVTRPGKAQGTDHPETDLQRRIKRLRPRRWRYPVAEYPRGGWRPRRAHSRLVLVDRPPQAPSAPEAKAPSSSITVVDYVLPEVQPQLPAPEVETDFVLHRAEPASVAKAGFNL